MSVIDSVLEHAASIRDGHERVSPGQPARLPNSASAGDGVWQGDLCIEVVAGVPAGYVRVDAPTDADRQLVPGNTQGSRHVLSSLDGVTMFRPAEWPNVTQLGPCLLLAQDAVVEHPTHGHVTIDAGQTVLCSYQREWDAEQRRQRRNAD